MSETVTVSTILSKQTQDLITEWLKKYPPNQKQAGIIFALMTVQTENKGWLSKDLIKSVADFLEIPHIAAFEVATFYTMFELEPIGKHKISVCTNISCLLSGSESIVQHLKNRLKIGFNQTTSDGLYTLKEVECLAACSGAPMMQVNKDYFENLTVEKVDEILNCINKDKHD